MKVLYGAAVLTNEQEDHDGAQRFGERGLRLAEAVGDPTGAAQALTAIGMAALGRGDYPAAAEHYRQSLAIWRGLDEPRGLAIALGNLAKLSLRIGDVDAADEYVQECLALERAAGNSRNIELNMETLIDILLARGDAAGARVALEENLGLTRELGDPFGEVMVVHQLGHVALIEGDRTEALRLFLDALNRRHELKYQQDLAVSFDTIAHLLAEENSSLAAELMGAADGLRQRHRLPVPPVFETQRQATLSTIRAHLDEAAAGAARASGRAAPLDLIVQRAREIEPAAAR